MPYKLPSLFCVFVFSFAFLCTVSTRAVADELDLRDSQYGKAIQEKSQVLRSGNEGTVKLTRCTLDTATQIINVALEIQPRHSWGEVRWTDYFSFPPVENTESLRIDLPVIGVNWQYNLRTNRVTGGVDVDLGERKAEILGRKLKWDFGKVRLSTEQIKRLMEGDLSSLAESIPNVAGITKDLTDKYDEAKAEVEQEFGANNVYFASKEPFVNECRPSKIGEYAISLIVSGGATGDAIMGQLTEIAEAEAANIRSWLETKGIAASNEVASAIMAGSPVVLPEYYLAIKWMPVEYRSRTYAFGNALTPSISETHGAFYIVVAPRPAGAPARPDFSGYDQGPIGTSGPVGPQQMPNRPHRNHLPVPFAEDLVRDTMYSDRKPAADPGAEYTITIHNHFTRHVHVGILRGAESHDRLRSEDPSVGVYLKCMAPDTKRETNARGNSERVIGVWDCESGTMLGATTLRVDRSLVIVISESGFDRSVRIAATQTYEGD